MSYVCQFFNILFRQRRSNTAYRESSPTEHFHDMSTLSTWGKHGADVDTVAGVDTEEGVDTEADVNTEAGVEIGDKGSSGVEEETPSA